MPWSESRSRFTALFEAVVIDWLQEATTAAVAQQLGLSWDEVDGVMQRAVQRGLQRREVQLPARLGVDETSFQKRHEYVTVINDLDGKVVYVADGRTKESLEKFYKQFDSEQLAQVPYGERTIQAIAAKHQCIRTRSQAGSAKPRRGCRRCSPAARTAGRPTMRRSCMTCTRRSAS